jgi:hypothetical protein
MTAHWNIFARVVERFQKRPALTKADTIQSVGNIQRK